MCSEPASRQIPHSTRQRRFNIYASDIGQMVALPRLSTFLAKEAPGASVRVLTIPDNPGAALSSGEVDFAIGFHDNLKSGFLRSSVLPEHYVCIVRAGHPRFRTGMSLEAFVEPKHAVADSTGTAHAIIIEQVLARHRIHRKDAVRVPGFHVLPMIVANSDLLAVVPNRLAQAFARFEAIKILSVPVSIPPYAVNVYWHERYHHDPPNQWFRGMFVKLHRPSKSQAARNGRSRSKS